MDLVGQVRRNANCTNDIVVDDIVIHVQSNLAIEPLNYGDSSLRSPVDLTSG